MPPVDFPRGNNAAAKPPPAPKPVANLRTGNNPRGTAIVPSRTAPTIRAVARNLAPVTTSRAKALPSAPASTRTSSNPRGVAITQPTAKPAVKAAAPSPAMAKLKQTLMQLWQGSDQAFLAPTDPIARNASQVFPQQAVQGQFNQDFASLRDAGLLPQGAVQPPLSFVSRGAGPEGGLSYERNGRIFVSPATVTAATSLGSPLHAWGQETPIHELAHAMQRPGVLQSVPLREGGAQAYADAVVPTVLGPLPENDTNYTGYVNRVRAKQGVPWFMRRQFR